jgi:aminopeptidase N
MRLSLNYVVKIFVLLLLSVFSFVSAQSAGSDSLNDPIYAFMGNGGYDALDYQIDLRFSSDKKTVIGITTIEAMATQDLSSFNLDFGAMTVSNVVVNGESARYSQADPEMTIAPNRFLIKGERFKVSIVYSGVPSTKLAAASSFGNWFISRTGLTALAEPSLMFTWSPVNEHPSDKATFSLKLTSSKNDTAIANGEFVGRTENADGTASSSYRIATPTATYFVVMAVGNWKLEEEGKVGDVRVRHYLASGTTSVMRSAIAETGRIVEFFSQKLIPYPFKEVGVLTSDNNLGFALETQTLVTLPLSWSGNDLVASTEVVAHELAHQWFGALVTFKNHSDMFIHEGFAEYLGWVYSAYRYPNLLGSRYIEEQIEDFYPASVHGRLVRKYTKEQFTYAMEYRLGYTQLSKENVAKALDLLFSSSLPANIQADLLARVPPEGWSKFQFIAAFSSLPFNHLVFVYKNFYEVIAMSGGEVPALSANWGVVTPPAKLQPEDNLFNWGVYTRGATALHALRLKIGDDAFWKLLRGFLEKYKFANASNTDWLEHVANNSGQAVRDWQEHWLFDELPPEFPELGLKPNDFALGADFK